MIKKLLILILVFFSVNIYAVKNDTFLIKSKNGRIVFLGDSITAWKRYDTLIESYLRTRFPDRNYTFRNLGRSGDTTWFIKRGGVDNGFKRDILPLKPDIVFINLGINDTNYGIENISDTEQGLSRLIDLCRSAGSEVIVLSPSAFDGKEENMPAGNAKNILLEKFVSVIEKTAVRKNCVYIDLYHPYIEAIEKIRAQSNKDFLLNRDGTHPNWTGHLVIAWTILKELNAPELVSTAELDFKTSKVITSDNCEITDLKKTANKISFLRSDKCLPWPIEPNCYKNLMIKKQILDRLSRYEIKIHGVDLKKNYEIFIDRESCGKFSGSRLAEGVNLTSRAGSVTKQNRMILYFIDESREIYLTRWRRIQISEFPVKYNEQICQEYKDRALKKMDESIEVLDQALRWLSKPKPRHFVIKEL